ncbi:MAG TPA: aminotransferase class IV [Candidatus Methylacidiphilales bacterium]|jgi:branched-chain amino acid aminotransferase/4-amino-4-deoxychorismate lyase|nr:aminotransferase class IV [Candidatus Methylacidiphilales bacterium]
MMQPSAEFAPWLGVFETLRVVDGTPLFMAEHRAELARAMEALGLKSDFDFERARAALPAVSGRWRWVVTSEEARALFSTEEASAPEPLALAVSPVRVGSCNWDARFKTVSYLSHVQAWKTAKTTEVVLLNEHGHVASASRGNIFWRRGDRMFTPAHEAGCRCGVVRGFVCARQKVEEGHFSLGDLPAADEIFLTNSMKGIVSVYNIEGRPVPSSASAAGLRNAYDEAVAAQLSSS